MSVKTKRLEVRVDAATKALIENAATRLSQSASTFVVHAATVETDRVLARAETTLMPHTLPVKDRRREHLVQRSAHRTITGSRSQSSTHLRYSPLTAGTPPAHPRRPDRPDC